MALTSLLKKNTKIALQNVIIIGAGEAGYLLYKSIQEEHGHIYKVVGFLDDDPTKIQNKINGTKVIGRICDLERVISKYDIKEIFVALPSGSSSVISGILKRCEAICAPVRIIPSSYAKTNNNTVTLKSLKKVEVEDLLDRDTYSLDFDEQRKIYQDKVVLITGAAGSVGSQLCRDLVKISPKKIVMLDNRESELFDLYNDLVSMHHRCPIELVIADIRDRGRMFSVFDKVKPETTFHAAAYKHVPLMEIAPCESVKTNIRGTRLVLEAASAADCTNFVLVSTDKAIEPINVMGASKRMAEQQALNFARDQKIKCAVVRFGNVLGSSGSVLPLFEEQIRKGGPITITTEDVNRYFISIEEASALLLSVPNLTKAGDKTFLLDMGEPVKILDLAHRILALRGLEPNVDIDIEFCGLRTGEKISEKLTGRNEKLSKSANDRIFVVNKSNNHPNPLVINDQTIDEIENAAIDNKIDSLYQIFAGLFPSFDENNLDEKSFEPKEKRISPFSMNSEMERKFSYLFSSDLVNSREDAFILALFKAGLEPISYETALYLTSAKLDWQEVILKAKKHKIGALIYYHLKPHLEDLPIPKEQIETLRKIHDWTVSFNKHMYRDIKTLAQELNKRKIKYILLKGALLVATVYNNEPLRPVGDIDILVKDKDIESVQEIIKTLGYQPTIEDEKIRKLYRTSHHHLVPYYKKHDSKNTVIEIHRSLVPLPSVLGFGEDEIWDKAIPITIDNTQVNSLSYEQMVNYLCIHGLFTDASITLRQILDLSLVIRHFADDIDWQKLSDIAKKSVLSKSVYIALNLVKEMCSTPVQLDYTPKFTFIDKKLIKSLRRGVFGDVKFLPPALVQLLLLEGFGKTIMLRKIISPHPFHQVDPANYSSNRWRQTQKLIRSSISSFAGLLKKKGIE